ncbi:MAG: glycosyltransferase, partial [Acidobacteriota bacterium]
RLFSSSDLVVGSAASLAEEAKAFDADPLLLRNACEYDHFAAVGRTMNARPVVGYYGAIADWFDSDLVTDLAKRRKDWDFVLVGSTDMADISKLIKLPNVTLTGEQPYATLPRWLTRFDVTIIPFKRMPLTEATNPVKAYEILAAGKPLISVPLPEVAALGSIVRLASTAAEFEREIEAALKEYSAELIEQRRAFAKANTWERRFQALSPAVSETFPQASIIIVTYNNLDLNRLCLEKLYERTEWPNFEVIVVDNASTDGTPEYLKEAERVFPNLRVVLNGGNRGFAAANNIGLKMATGEFLVLLNNDTVVTRGWLTAMLRHLQTDSGIGLIGPVTNAISNEAKIEVGYQQIEEMPNWAAGYVREHDGETFQIPMLAMFCVAMRRQVFEEVGLLDEQFGIGMFEDDDYCRRISNRGYQLLCTRDSFIHHWQRASFKLLGEDEYLRIYQENQRKFEEKWRHAISDSEMDRQRRQLREVIARIQQSRGVVIFLPSIGWRVHLFQRPHHLAQTFARQGYVAIFDSSDSLDGVNGFEEIEHNLFLFNGPQELLHEIPQPVLWTLPYNFDRSDKYPDSACKVYDWIDDLAVFPYDREFLESNHRRALAEAAVVASVAAPLHKQALSVRPDAIYLPNGVEFEAFAQTEKQPERGQQPERGRSRPQPGSRTFPSALQPVIQNDCDLDNWVNKGKPLAGYYGALASWFDYDLLDSVAEQKPNWNFLLIGQTLDESLSRHSLLNRTNVKWIGPREYASLPGYLQLFDVAMIPFVINEITLATSPLKLYEYMAGGKPVIATPMPECEAFSDVFIARNAEEFARLLDTAAARGREADFQHRLQTLAQENSWTARVRVIEHVLESKQDFSPTKPHEEGTKEERQPRLVEAPTAAIAERFGHFRSADNERFFAALTNHFSSIPNDPCLPMYFEFAVTCNERGRRVAGLLNQHTDLRGKRYLDLGCAYAGFLVAFAEHGAEVSGVDNDDSLLNLARHNLRDHNLDVPLRLLDATSENDLRPMRDSFDIITCNDVIEHVDDPQALIRNIANLLTEGGLAYFEIPNALAPHHVLSDGHYQIFGITLLDYEQASEYFSVRQPGVGYSVRHYLKLEVYERMFAECGLSFTLLEESFESVSLETIQNAAAELRASATAGLSDVQEDWRELIGGKLAGYLETIESAPLDDEPQRQNFLANYGPSFWRVLARKEACVHNPIVIEEER